ncbi:SH2 domain-containing protein 2A [Phascolarctos cinereus]|uniref:SH2 domain-containing protein 2A isoform X1 n=2 Tax=Phascolarctos cinereus TaxID=38626 RepID=A0A6P5KT18_PHACI|nr:SH2 domain-containing protein 2A isoform X1 [Phascolarctos cinereus]
MEIPIDQMPPQGEWKEPAPTFSTFHPKHPTRKSRRSMALPNLPQALEDEGFPPNHTKVSLQGRGTMAIPGNTRKAEEVPGLGGPSLQAETRAWFQKTQAPWLLHDGEAPVWFHGFITRREAERLLENKPPGCYLVRFSESAVAFVLTYRSRSCYRHFLLAQLEDGRHVVLGEDSAHERLPDLLRHYTLCPLSPYGEHLTQPCIRQTPAPAGISMQIEHSESRSEGRNGAAQYSPVHKQEQTLGPVNKDNPGPREPEELPRPKPPVPTKPQILPELYSIPAPKASHPAPRPMPPHPIYQEPEEPIAFYAMGRGSKKDGLVNVYSEVAPLPLGHHFLQKCQSRLVTVTQTLDQGATSSLRHQPPQGHTLPPNFSRQLPQDRVQVQLLGSNKH